MVQFEARFALWAQVFDCEFSRISTCHYQEMFFTEKYGGYSIKDPGTLDYILDISLLEYAKALVALDKALKEPKSDIVRDADLF